MNKSIVIEGHTIALTHVDKYIFPEHHITKNDLISYYLRVAPIMLLHVKNRPIAMQRFPEGIDHEGFYQKQVGSYFPSFIKTKNIATKEGPTVTYGMINNTATLIYLTNQGCITPHIWLSKTPHISCADRMIFDLDPAPNMPFNRLVWTARELRTLLHARQLPAFIMTTGSRGLHIVVPLQPTHNFDLVRAYARMLAQTLVDAYPDKVTLEMHKQKRGKRVFIDILRNSYGATTVAPYAVRALPGAPIATPIDWHELSTVSAQKYTIKNIFRRLAQVDDPWHTIEHHASVLPHQ